MHEAAPQPCVPHWGRREELRPEPARRQMACEDFDVIGARLAELRQEQDAMRGKPEDVAPAVDHLDCCY